MYVSCHLDLPSLKIPPLPRDVTWHTSLRYPAADSPSFHIQAGTISLRVPHRGSTIPSHSSQTGQRYSANGITVNKSPLVHWAFLSMSSYSRIVPLLLLAWCALGDLSAHRAEVEGTKKVFFGNLGTFVVGGPRELTGLSWWKGHASCSLSPHWCEVHLISRL